MALAEKRLVDEAVVEKKLVVVAEEPVAFKKVKFWRVEDPVTRRLVVVAAVKVALPTVKSLAVLSQRKFESEVRAWPPLKKATWPEVPPLAVRLP